MERGLLTPLKKLRRQVFVEVARVAFHTDKNEIKDAIEAIPYTITPGDKPLYRESIWRERAICSERVRLCMGLSLRPEDMPVHVTSGLRGSDIADKYYEPPLMQVIPSACAACAPNLYKVTDNCRGCVAHPCTEVCPKGAVSIVNGKSFIDQSKCIKCGKCKAVCPYDAIAHHTRPCAEACGVKAIESDDLGRAKINNDKCVSCGMCMVSCPFGAIADKSQIFQLIRALRRGDDIVAEVAPSYVGQFGDKVTPGKFKAALLEMGFSEVYEVALGADMGAAIEAEHYAEQVATGKQPYMFTSCCPSWAMLIKRYFPETADKLSNTLTPMVATARTIKQKHPDSRVVFIGPCAAKKLEASRRTVRSDVDFVITFEELSAMFEAKGIDLDSFDKSVEMNDATGAGRGYAVAGGVAGAIGKCIEEYYPNTPLCIEHVEGLEDCRKMLLLAKMGKKNGCLIEGMGCPGGCVAGAGTNIPVNKAAALVKKTVETSAQAIPPKELAEVKLD
ncbi:MAG TPA: 4Fe-4S dicluster domain-containing protein [Candidatus Borkfalkia excrementigallinarum]|uniref:4Fe-4S dicluster domain-containing protein n=1 Tax=Candidatus Borkfalkia excrementigallinarum TaxID=2838506 RepID=A0A9D2CRX7_9FIRM|nr:4Fe-4S dicluster domain-containing protein [Candidatus Borkfalkia excrementigallinarum]